MPSASDANESAKATTARSEMCGSLRKLLVTQSTSVITGVMFMDAVLASVAAIILGQSKVDTSSIGIAVEDAAKHPWYNLLFQMFVYVTILSITSYTSSLINASTKIPNQVSTAYKNGIKLIPAWAWKTFVSSIIDILTALKLLDMDVPGQAGLFALVVIVSSATLQVTLEAAVPRVGPFVKSLVETQRTCMALAAGYVLHLFFSTFASSSTTGEFLYVGILSAVLPAMQAWLNSWNLEPGTAKASANFAVSSLNFVLAYAWNDALDTTFATLMSQGVAGQLLVSVLMTMLGVLVVFLSHTDWVTESHVSELVVVVAGMNVGWSWTDFASACIGEQSVSLLVFWLFTTAVIAAWICVAVLMECGIGQLEKSWKLPMQAVLEKGYGSA